jgi:hypothetical protein
VDDQPRLVVMLCVSLIAASVAGALALNPLFIQGFAPACSDGYAEANGALSCEPIWRETAPYLVALCLALVGASVSATKLFRRWHEVQASRVL